MNLKIISDSITPFGFFRDTQVFPAHMGKGVSDEEKEKKSSIEKGGKD